MRQYSRCALVLVAVVLIPGALMAAKGGEKPGGHLRAGGLPADGDYLLTVKNGNGQSHSDQYDLTIGAGGGSGPAGATGATGATGS